MLKKILTLFTAVVLALTLFTSLAFAEGVTVSALYSSKNNTVSVSGNAKGNVVITIASEELSPDNMSEDNMPDVVKAVTAKGGKYFCEIGLPEGMSGGKYIVYATTEDSEALTSFIYVNVEGAELIIQKINSAETVDELIRVLDAEDEALGISKEDPVYSQNKRKIAGILHEKDYEDYNDFIDEYKNIYPLVALFEASAEDVEKILEEHQTALGIDFNEDIKNDERLSQEATKKLYALISSEDFTENYGKEGKSLADRLEEMKAISVLYGSENWMTIKKVITELFKDTFADMLDSSSKYKKIDDKDEVFAEMMEYSLSSFSDVEEAFEKSVAKVYKKENPSNNTQGGTSSGGGGSFSSGTAYTTPPEIDLYEEVETSRDVFSDVPAAHWANQAVNALNAKKVISGYPDGTFLPSNRITRAEFAKLAVSFAGEAEKGESVKFSDVKESDWFYPYVSDAAALKIISGLDDGSFAPQTNIKREDAALIVYRLLTSLGKTPAGSKVFSDRSEISSYARSAISALGASGIVTGSGNGAFSPKGFITRAEAAQLLYNAFVK